MISDKDRTELQNSQAGNEDSQKFLVNKVAKRRGFCRQSPFCIFSLKIWILLSVVLLFEEDYLMKFWSRQIEIIAMLFLSTKRHLSKKRALYNARETGERNEKQFEYWDKLIIENGNIVTLKRKS